MGLSKYVMACEGLAQELRDSLTEAEISELYNLLQGLPLADWIKLRLTHQKSVSAFVRATPTQRKGAKFRKDRLILTLAGIQHCLEAHAMLSVVNESFLEPGCSYRDMAARAGDAYERLFDFAVPDWPFDELDSPFVDDDDQ